MAYRAVLTGNFINAKELAVTHLLQVIIRDIKN